MDDAHSRRTFVAGLVTAVACPLFSVGCSRDERTSAPDPAAQAREAEINSSLSLAELPAEEPIVRVCIVRARSRDESVQIGLPGQWVRLVGAHDNNDGLVINGPVTVKLQGQAWSVRDGKGFRPRVERLGELSFYSVGSRQTPLAVGEALYPGSIRIVALENVSEHAFDVVNHVAVEAYLPGVLVRELYNHWHVQTHAAQAVAARSFACSEHAYFRNRRHYDLMNTQASQVYSGLSRHQVSIDAVQTTRGQVLAFHDRLVPGYYSSCCGGLAARAQDAIGPNPINRVKPLDGRSGEDVCRNLAVARWQVERSTPSLTERLRLYGGQAKNEQLAAFGIVRSFEPSQMNPHGRPTHYRLGDAEGRSIELTARAFHQAANFGGETTSLRSMLWSSHLDARIERQKTVFQGRGFGHGVGLCQYGAQELAQQGMQYRAIIVQYYPGVTIAQAYA